MKMKTELFSTPKRIQALPKDSKGRFVPWFVWWNEETGVPDFRVIAPDKIKIAVRERRCWVCGDFLGKYLAFVIGPMCSVNRISSEPPSHRECALYSARVCPFLTTPKMHRNEKGLPLDSRVPGGLMIPRNPGVTLVWVTRGYQIVRAPGGGALFQVGEPTETLWFAEGRTARREEILSSIESGLPILQKEALADGEEAMKELDRQVIEALKLVPKE